MNTFQINKNDFCSECGERLSLKDIKIITKDNTVSKKEDFKQIVMQGIREEIITEAFYK